MARIKNIYFIFNHCKIRQFVSVDKLKTYCFRLTYAWWMTVIIYYMFCILLKETYNVERIILAV